VLSTNGSFAGSSEARAILYARVSTEDQAEEGYSLPEQVRDLTRYAKAQGYTVLGEPIEDDGYSGRTMNRPGLALVRELAADGAFDVLLVAKWNRLFRRGAYQDLFIAEMKLAGIDVISLDGQKNDTPAGKLFNRMMADFSEYQRDDLVETMQRGKRGRARQGKVVPSRFVPYGFSYDPEIGNYRVHEDRMRAVRAVFRMVGVEGRSLYQVTKALQRDGVPTPAAALAEREGKPPVASHWRHRGIRLIIENDVYKAHAYEEIKAMVSAEVAATLDPDKRYGVQWYNRARYERTPDENKVVHVTPNKPEEWIAVPVPDAGIPRELVEAAREAIKDNKAPSSASDRFWELTGGILTCDECGWRMTASTMVAKAQKRRGYYYYHCPKRRQYGKESCSHAKHHPAEKMESAVWSAVSSILKDPEQLRADLDCMIELERRGMRRRDPDKEARLWAEKLAEAERMRRGYQEQAAKGYMSLDELGAALEMLEEARKTAERELRNLKSQQEFIEELERDKEALLDYYAALTPEALDALTAEERHQLYKILKLKASAGQDGSVKISGVFGDSFGICKSELAPPYTSSQKSMASGKRRPASYWRRLSSGVGSGRFATRDGP
jgi:site-specific DNA recombinase